VFFNPLFFKEGQRGDYQMKEKHSIKKNIGTLPVLFFCDDVRKITKGREQKRSFY
jgi:hypothetical protein